MLGGEGVVVQIDKSLFVHKVKHHRGHPPRDEVWVYGMVDTSFTSPFHGHLQVVARRDAATSLPIIQTHVRPGTIIWSDQWRAYSGVASLPNVALDSTVNHSLEFKNPVTGVHTKNVELLEVSQGKLKKMKGCKHKFIPSYLDELLWKDWYGSATPDIFSNLVRDIALQYPV